MIHVREVSYSTQVLTSNPYPQVVQGALQQHGTITSESAPVCIRDSEGARVVVTVVTTISPTAITTVTTTARTTNAVLPMLGALPDILKKVPGFDGPVPRHYVEPTYPQRYCEM